MPWLFDTQQRDWVYTKNDNDSRLKSKTKPKNPSKKKKEVR